MSAEEEACIVAASYQGAGSKTVVELWLRAREGHSTLLLVHGLRPFLEIAVIGKATDLPADIEERLEKVRKIKDVTLIHPPVDKWTDLGTKPHWKVEAKQPYNVPKIRDALKSDGWVVTSADIVFPQRLLLDLDLNNPKYKGRLRCRMCMELFQKGRLVLGRSTLLLPKRPPSALRTQGRPYL